MSKTDREIEALRYLGWDSVADDLAEDDSPEFRAIIVDRLEKLGSEGWAGVSDAIRIVNEEPIETIPAAYIGEAARGAVEGIGALLTAAAEPAAMDVDELNEADLSAEFVDGFLANEWEVVDNAEEAIDGYALAVERSTTFEIVTGTGGPDCRFLIECDVYDERPPRGPYGEAEPMAAVYEIRRVGFRYSWSGSSETWFSGTAADVVKAYASRVVPELIE